MLTRRHLLTTGLSCAAAATLPLRPSLAQGSPSLGQNRLVLLGTKGGPAIRAGYKPSPSAHLIVYNGVPYVIDTGYGVSFKLVEAKFPLGSCATCSSRITIPITTPSSVCWSTMRGRRACADRSMPTDLPA